MKKIVALGILIIFVINIYFIYEFQYAKRSLMEKKLIIGVGESKYKTFNKVFNINETLLKIFLKLYHENKTFKAGIYYFNKDSYRLKDIFNIFEKGEYKTIKVLIPEGFTLKQIKNRLMEKGLINEEKFMEALEKVEFEYYVPNGNYEGYFFPDTYYFYEGESEESIIEKFFKRFREKFSPNDIGDKKKFYEKLVMASIIEKEAYFEEEKKLMASVFYNRMKKRMRLESCATLEYIFDYKKKKILYSDLKIESEYNTYRNYGLPPTAISNPGESSIYAALKPKNTDYLYFVKKDDRSHYFSKTYKEHLRYKREVKNGTFKKGKNGK